MSHEQEGLEAGVPGWKDCLRLDSNNPERPKLSRDDPDECVGDNAVKTRHRLQSKYNILLACLAGTDLLVGAASQPTFIAGQIYVIKGLSVTEYCRYYEETHLIFFIPLIASMCHLTLISIEQFVAMKYTFHYVTIVTEFRLKMAVVSSWVIACCPAILERLFAEFEKV